MMFSLVKLLFLFKLHIMFFQLWWQMRISLIDPINDFMLKYYNEHLVAHADPSAQLPT